MEKNDFIKTFLPNFKIRIAPLTTTKKTTAPTIRSGYFDWVTNTKTPARITPVLKMTSFEVKIMLAFMWASLLFDF